MCTERYVRLFAGLMILASLVLAHFVTPWFYALTVFVGLNLFQSALTKICPLEWILRAMGVPNCGTPAAAPPVSPPAVPPVVSI